MSEVKRKQRSCQLVCIWGRGVLCSLTSLSSLILLTLQNLLLLVLNGCSGSLVALCRRNGKKYIDSIFPEGAVWSFLFYFIFFKDRKHCNLESFCDSSLVPFPLFLWHLSFIYLYICVRLYYGDFCNLIYLFKNRFWSPSMLTHKSWSTFRLVATCSFGWQNRKLQCWVDTYMSTKWFMDVPSFMVRK